MTGNQEISPEELYIEQLGYEAAGMSPVDREEHDKVVESLITGIVAEAGKEIDLRQQLLDRYMGTIALATEYQQAQAKAAENRNKPQDPKVAIDFSRIGWINREESAEVKAEEVKTVVKPYLFIDLTGENAVTRDLRDELKQQDVDTELMDTVKEKVIPKLWDGVKSGHSKGLRPVAIGNRSRKEVDPEQSLNTTYPAYKVDVQGTNNRGIILILDGSSEMPAFGLAALYDHDDDGRVHRSLFLKQK